MVLLCGTVVACGGSPGSGGQSGIPGEESAKPGGGTFFVDENRSGGASDLHLSETRWGRLVDIHEIDALGKRVETPVFRDFVVEPDILTSPSYVLERNPVTQRERLVIQAQKTGVPDSSAFDQLLLAASDNLPFVPVRGLTSSPPFEIVPRNACLSLRFDDCLKDDAAATAALAANVNIRVTTGYPPTTPFTARIVFDPNHGGLVGSAFHSTRVLVDLTTSPAEAAALPIVVDPNSIGLPARSAASSSPNVAIRVPSRVDVGSTQPTVLTNLSGARMDASQNGPVDPNSLTVDVVRAIRSGSSKDLATATMSNGFLPDKEKPRVIGSWPVVVTGSDNDLAGDTGFDFLVDVSFSSTCRSDPQVGDVLVVGSSFMVVSEAGTLAGADVADLKVRTVASTTKAALLGVGQFQQPFLPTTPVSLGCFVSFLPSPTTFPATGVSPSAQVIARFSEPMDPATLSPFREFLVVRGAAGPSSTAITSNLIAGQVQPSTDLATFTLDPGGSMPHQNGVAEAMHLELGNAKDLAGNTLRHALPFVDFLLDATQATATNGSLVLRFESPDEYGPNNAGPDGKADLRGTFQYDTQRGSLTPRPVSVTGWPADRSNPVPLNMTAVPGGVTNPLNPRGAKMQMLWRYCDMGWAVTDETKYNLDVLGLNWAPVNGLVVTDFYDRFEIRLGHSHLLPDEVGGFANSGLPGISTKFEDNFLAGSNPTIVHNRALGYIVNPANLFSSTTGTKMLPYPLNRGQSPAKTYTWRDTTLLAKGADGESAQAGIPLTVEAFLGVDGGLGAGGIAGAGEVPSFGLPLLIELKCFPANGALGINALDVSVASVTVTTPNFRAYSAGGVNTSGNSSPINPDNEDFPSGGFNPNSTPIAGAPTRTQADNVFYIGQLDAVVRVSRIHTAWLDSGVGAPAWRAPILEPTNAQQPLGTAVRLDFRSATGFAGGGALAQFNAASMDVYGDQSNNVPSGLSDWSSNVSIGNGKRYLQVRMTFENNIATGLTPELTALALPFDIP